MSKVAHYLQEHLVGEVSTSPDARRYFSTDNSIFAVAPSIIVYPRNENDVRKATRFTWQLAERGRVIPITARGWGTDLGGGAIGSGILLVFPAHMNRIIELDQKTGIVVVEPGLNYGRLQQTLHTHERFLPPYPNSLEYSSIGGAVSNNASGEKSVKYGSTREYVKSLRVVLANGEVIESRRLSKRELNKKMGLTTFEGEIYRQIDALLEDKKQLVDSMSRDTTKNTAGYNLANIKRRDGTFDLTPLFVGAQGTLGVITEITCETEAYNPETVVFAGFFSSIAAAAAATQELRSMQQMPSAIEFVDGYLLNIVNQLNPNQLKQVIPNPVPAAALVIEFDNAADRKRKKIIKQARKILEKHAESFKEETTPAQQASLWKVRHAAATVMGHSEGSTKPLPIIDDGVVPIERLEEYLTGIYSLFSKAKLDVAVWGHAGDGNIHVQPFLDIAQLGDRQKAFRLMEEFYDLTIGLGGVTSGQYNDGRLRAPYLAKQYGEDIYGLFVRVKQIFDPYNTMNPGVKIGVTNDDIRPLLRNSYSLDHLYRHMPRS